MLKKGKGTKWVLTLLVLLVFVFACGKQEDKPAGKQPAAAAGQTGMATEQAKGPTTAPVSATDPAKGETATASGDQGQAVYQKACASCHETGVSGASKLSDKAAWSSRIAKGKDQLVQSVINGKGAMPPKAGNPALTEAEIRAAVDYIAAQVR